MFNKKYKKGMADAAKAYKDFGKKQENAIEEVLQEVRQGNTTISDAVQSLKGNIDNLYSYLKSKEKADLYSVYTPFDIKNLDENERLFLVGALLHLTMDKTPTEEQQNYLRSIQKYLEIKEPPFGVDLTAIENIENIKVQKAIYQSVLEYLILQDGDSYDETELQQEFLDCFNLNPKNRMSIAEHVEILYSATGALGLAEKYGYVGEKEEDNSRHDYLNLVIQLLNDKSLNDHDSPIETEDYIVIFKSFFSKEDAEMLIIGKEQGKVIKTLYGGNFFHCFCIYSHKNSICFYDNKNIYTFDIDKNTTHTLISNFVDCIVGISFIDEKYIIFQTMGNMCYLFNRGNGECTEIPRADKTRIIDDSIIYADYSSIKKYHMVNKNIELSFEANSHIEDFEIYKDNIYVLSVSNYGNLKKCFIHKLKLNNPQDVYVLNDNVLTYGNELPFEYYHNRKHYNNGWLYISEPNEEIFKISPQFNLMKFDFKNENIIQLATSCGRFTRDTLGNITSISPEEIIVLRNYVFFKKEDNYISVDIDNSNTSTI